MRIGLDIKSEGAAARPLGLAGVLRIRNIVCLAKIFEAQPVIIACIGLQRIEVY